MRRHDLIGAPASESFEVRVARARVLLEDIVEPAWRHDPPILIHHSNMDGVCDVAGCARETVDAGLCNGHVLRWIRRGRPNLPEYVRTTRTVVVDNHVLRGCDVPACRLGAIRPGHLCPGHRSKWQEAGQPASAGWVAAATVNDAGVGAPVCRLPHCELLAHENWPYCRVHAIRWHKDGCPGHAVFEAAIMNYGDPRWDFRRLPEQLRLELQYGLQRSHQAGFGKGSHSVGYAARMLLRIGAASLLERHRAGWDALFLEHIRKPGSGAGSRAFLGYAVEQLADLLDGAGWDNEYPRDLWQLHRLGYVDVSMARQLNFTGIGQRWLVDCAKRWLHWRLTVEEKSVNTVLADLLSLRRLSSYLEETGQAQHSVRQLTRPVIEQHLASIHAQRVLASSTIRDHVSAIAVFLRALQDHEDWAPDLPRNAVIYSSDYPRCAPLRARGLNTHVMTQVRAQLPSWPHPDGQFLTELMIATGLRLGDARALGYDPMVFDNDANPYIRYWNHKMRREAYVPVSQAMLARIRVQQERTALRFPAESARCLAAAAPRTLPAAGLRLTPRSFSNRDGSRPFAGGTYQQQLRTFQTAARINDEAGRPVVITANQWRHTFATGLINRGVRLEVVKQLLDHASLEMTSHYARLLDATIRAEWEAGRGPDDDYGHLLPADADWANRARTALPNGQCGLPRQQTCAHSNKCLP